MHRIDWYRVAGAIIGLLSALLVASILFEGVAHAAPTRAQVAQAVDPAFRRSNAPWIAVAVAAVADIATTEAALHRGCHEANPIYGSHPSVASLGALHAIPLALLWPVRHSKLLYIPAAVLAAVAVHNATLTCR